jgi:hypothetical protein
MTMRIAKWTAPAALALGTATFAAAGSERPNLIALSGQAAPVPEAGVTFQSVDYAAINNAGQVVFQGKLQGNSITPLNDGGYFRASAPSNVSVAAREGDPIENYPGDTLTLSTFWPSSFNDAGQVAFTGRVTTLLTVITNAAFVSPAKGGPVHALAVQNAEYPDGSGERWGSNFGVALNDAGQAGVADRFRSIWTGSSAASLQRLAGSGDDAGTGAGDTIYDLGSGLRMNNSMVAVNARLSTGGGTANASAVLAGFGKNAIVIARSGQLAPADSAGATFKTVTLQGLSLGHRTLVHATLEGPGISTANDTGLWRFPNPLSLSPEGPFKIVQEGDPAPGFGEGAKFGPITSDALFPGDALALFSASVTGAGANNFGVWEWLGNRTLKRLISVGDTVAGAPAGTTVGAVYYKAANGAGQASFGGVLSDQHAAIFGYDPTLGRVLLVKEGDAVEVAPGDVRTIKQLGLSYGGLGRMTGGTGHDGLITPLNDAGLIAFQATFTDGSQAILTVRVPVAGDATNDGIVNSTDFHILLDNFDKPPAAPDRSRADFNLDGRVTFADFQLLESNFGRTPPGISSPVGAADYAELAQFAATAPEPAALAIVALAACGFARHRRRCRVTLPRQDPAL